MTTRSDVVVLCEGFDDRSFWRGLLLRAGMREQRSPRQPRYQRKDVYSFETAQRQIAYVVPCGARGAAVMTIAESELADRRQKPLGHLVINVDVDLASIQDIQRSVESLVRRHDASAAATGTSFSMDGGATNVHLAPWFSGSNEASNAPGQQTLERLICIAIERVFPTRASAVASWLGSRPDPLGKEHKAHAWSHYAGWYTSRGTGNFYEAMWEDERVGAALQALLSESGIWQLAQSIAS